MMTSDLLTAIVNDLRDALGADDRVVVSSERLALNRKIADTDKHIYLDVILTSLSTENIAKQAVTYDLNVDLRIASRVRNEQELTALVDFTDQLQRRLSRGWVVDDFRLQSLQWQGIDRIADVSDVYITYLTFNFSKTLYE